MKEKQNYSDQDYLSLVPLPRAMVHLCVPMMLGVSVGVIYNILNAFFIGMLNDTTLLSAVTFGLPVTALIIAMGSLWGVGGGTLVSRLLGAGENKNAAGAGGLALAGSLVTGVLVAILMAIFQTPVARILGADAAAFEATRQYVTLLFACTPLVAANFTLEQIVRAGGAAKASMNGMLIGTAANLVLDVLLILVLKMGVAGAAIAFGGSSLCGMVYYLWYLMHQAPEDRLLGLWRHGSGAMLREILTVGASDFVMTGFVMLTSLLLNHMAVAYGDDIVAAFGVSLRIVQLPEFLCMGLFMGMIPLMAYCTGSGDTHRLKKALKMTAGAIAVMTLLFAGVVFLFREPVFALFTDSRDFMAMGVRVLSVMLVSVLFTGLAGLTTSYFQATGQGTGAMVMSVLRGLLFIPLVFAARALWGLDGIIWSMAAAEILACAGGGIMLLVLRPADGDKASEQETATA